MIVADVERPGVDERIVVSYSTEAPAARCHCQMADVVSPSMDICYHHLCTGAAQSINWGWGGQLFL
jgi:hypothetical protein